MRWRLPRTLVAAATAVVLVAVASPVTAQAADLAPAGAYNAAQDALVVGDYASGRDRLAAVAASHPSDANVAALQAFYANADEDAAARDTALTRLSGLDATLRASVDRALVAIATAAESDIDYAPVLDGPNTAVVILGHGLFPDGRMTTTLVERLTAGLLAAETSPESPIVVTGGNPQLFVTEADAMTRWLVEHGIDRGRIHAEDKATQTPQNAVFTTALLPSTGATEVALATSPDHIRRATSDFLIAGATVVGALPLDPAAAPVVAPLPASARLGLTSDATKVIGIPRTYAIAPTGS